MKSKILLIGIGLASITVASCGGSNDNGASTTSTTPPTPTSTGMSLDTALVLGLAGQTSETSTPFAVNNGALTLTDTSETSAALSIDAI